MCQRWAAAVNSPELLESLSFRLGSNSAFSTLSEAARAACLSRSRAQLQWLLRHTPAAVHPRELELLLDLSYNASEADRLELGALADGCLAACGHQLRMLCLSVLARSGGQAPIFDVHPWFVNMQQLHTLQLKSMYVGLRMIMSLASLRSLCRLTITASRLVVGSGVALPPALTHLGLSATEAFGTFSQASACVVH